MNLLQKGWSFYFKKELIKQVYSKENGMIRVIRVFDKPRLIIGKMLQSGGMVKKIWEKAVSKAEKKGCKVKNALIIGLGCGDCAFVIKKYYPEAKMTGVEIDKIVVDMAQCYFNLATVKNLKIAIEDGIKYVNKLDKLKKKQQFELVIVDVYKGQQMPKAFKTINFYKKLKKLLSKNGLVMINHLFFDKHKKEAEEFVKTLDKVFNKIELVRTSSNLVILAWGN